MDGQAGVVAVLLRKNFQLEVLLALLCAGSMWFYVQRVLIPFEKADSAAHQRPRGNLSDLYPRWLGARELLLHHRNPYGRDITTEIQKGYYGRELDPARADDPKDRQGFAYPVYVVFLLAPLIGFPFHGVQIFFYWLLVALTAASVGLWLRVLRWELPPMAVAICIALTLGSFPAVQGIKLQQLSLLVAALLAGALACVASGFLFLGGALLALATIKPQLAWPLVTWLLLWAVGDWRARRKLVLGFGLVMALLLAGAEILLPGWWRMFAEAIGQYHQYTQNQSVIEVMLNQVLGSAAGGSVGRIGAQILAVIAVLACVPALWKLRQEQADSSGFSRATALVLALTVLVIPMFAPYNQVLLLPVILLLARDQAAFVSRSRGRRLAYGVGALLLGWQWAASLGLTVVYLLVSRASALDGWQWPFFATFALPVWVFALIFSLVKDEVRGSSGRGPRMMAISNSRAPGGATNANVNGVSPGSSRDGQGSSAWRRALALTLVLRLIYSVCAAIIALIQPVNWRLVHSNAFTENLRPPDHSLRYMLFGVWERFDTLWYLHIAAHGYDRPDSVVFFPLYPGLVRIMTLLVSPMAAALLTSTVAAFFLFWGLQELLLSEAPPKLVNQSVLLCAAWPASFIFFAGYAESLLFALIVWSLCMARRDRWLAAAVLGLAAASTKAVGVVVVVPLLIVALRHKRINALPVLLIPLGPAGFLGYLHWTGHGALASSYEQYWRTSMAMPWTTLWASLHALAHTPDPILVLNLMFLVLVFVLATKSQLRIEYLLYSAAAIVVFLCKETTPPLQSMPRYLLIVFPAFVGCAHLLQRPTLQSRFGMVCAALFVVNLGLLWLFLGWSLVL